MTYTPDDLLGRVFDLRVLLKPFLFGPPRTFTVVELKGDRFIVFDHGTRARTEMSRADFDAALNEGLVADSAEAPYGGVTHRIE